MQLCHCHSKKPYEACCGPFISKNKIPATPLELMRSRYTAYCLADMHYIRHTMKPPASDHFNAVETKQWAKQVTWLGLKIIKTIHEEETRGFVEFIASYELNGNKQSIHEVSEFRLEHGKWFYVDGFHSS